jgi:hypothetical protein
MINSYAAGNKVYRGGSSIATSGKVDPMGYVNRELGNRRSQLAQNMLKNSGQGGSSKPEPNMGPNPRHMSLLAVKMLGGKG